jgi:predicted Zn-dependent protease
MKSFLALVFLCLASALSAQPPQAAAPATLADIQTLVDHGHLDAAMTALQPLSAQTPAPPGVERLRGKILYMKNNFGEAEAAFAAATKQDPSDTESAQMRGVSLFRLGRPADAVPLLEHAHGAIPGTNVDGGYVLALSLMGMRRFDDSRRAFATLYGLAPDSAAAHVLAAHMFLRWENLAAAGQMAHKALEIEPHTPEAHLILGEVALAAVNLDEARLQFNAEIALNSVSGPAYEHLGDVLIRKQLYPDAQEALNRAILIEPYSTGPFILLGQALLRQGNAGLAVSYLQHAEQMDPSNILTHLTLVQTYRAMGNKEEAAREAKTAQDLQKTRD